LKKGLFVSLEGIDGCGRTTQVMRLMDSLGSRGFHLVNVDDLSTTVIGRRIGSILRNGGDGAITPVTRMLLLFAARAQSIHEVIKPALADGKIVVTESFTDSTLCCDGCGRGIDPALIQAIDRVSTGGLRPSLTILLDLPVDKALKRMKESGKLEGTEEERTFYEKVRKGYLNIAWKEPHRVKIVEASGDIEEVFTCVYYTLQDEMNPS
jgi:dTMP kinase